MGLIRDYCFIKTRKTKVCYTSNKDCGGCGSLLGILYISYVSSLCIDLRTTFCLVPIGIEMNTRIHQYMLKFTRATLSDIPRIRSNNVIVMKSWVGESWMKDTMITILL